MRGAYAKGVVDPTTGRGRLVAALLVVALLLCHGALGALHQASPRPDVHTGGHHDAASQAVSAQGHAAHHDAPVAHADYAAALFVVLLGAALALFANRFLVRSLAISSLAFGRAYLRLVLVPPPTPVPPILQVFRL